MYTINNRHFKNYKLFSIFRHTHIYTLLIFRADFILNKRSLDVIAKFVSKWFPCTFEGRGRVFFSIMFDVNLCKI